MEQTARARPTSRWAERVRGFGPGARGLGAPIGRPMTARFA